MRLRGRAPEALVLLGLLLAAGVLAAYLLTRGPSHRAAPTAPPTTTTTTPPTTAPPPTTTAPPAPPSQPTVTQLTASSAVLSWRTAAPVAASVTVGTPSLGPTRWLPSTPAETDHAVAVGGLQPGRPYRVWISAGGAETSVDLTTPVPAGPVTATTAGGTVLLDGQPWFPLMVYGPCSTLYPSLLADGITLFAANPCGGLPAQLDALAGRGLSAGVSGEDDTTVSGPGLVGTFYPDEADDHGYTGAHLPLLSRPGLGLLTLTSHFYSGAAPPATGRAVYPGLVARADLVGFDLYPLQGWCSPDRLGDVYDAQRELVALAEGRPTFQWIEAAGMNCPTDAAAAVTPQTVTAESWLAIVGGARALGFFPAAWTGDVGGAIGRVADAVAALLPALAQPPQPVTVEPAGSPVRAAAWQLDGATYVAAVDPGGATTVTLRVPGLGSRALTVLGESRSVAAQADAIADAFAPLQVHLYVAAPAIPADRAAAHDANTP